MIRNLDKALFIYRLGDPILNGCHGSKRVTKAPTKKANKPKRKKFK